MTDFASTNRLLSIVQRAAREKCLLNYSQPFRKLYVAPITNCWMPFNYGNKHYH